MIRLIPLDLGGSPRRCEIWPPAREPITPELAGALIESYRADPRYPDAPLERAFVHGGLPTDALLAVEPALPWRLSCSPADLSPEDADRVAAAGVRLVELEVLTWSDEILRAMGRGYTARRVDAMRQGLARRGIAVGLGLMPGLPGSNHRGALDDVARALSPDLPRPAHVRILPALALRGSGLQRAMEEGRWRPMRLSEAITAVEAMLDLFEEAGVPVARVGLQPGQDLPWRLAGGPWHPNLRGLVEDRRFRRRMLEALRSAPRGGSARLRVHPKDLGLAKGASNQNLRRVRVALGLEALELVEDPELQRGRIEVA